MERRTYWIHPAKTEMKYKFYLETELMRTDTYDVPGTQLCGCIDKIYKIQITNPFQCSHQRGSFVFYQVHMIHI